MIMKAFEIRLRVATQSQLWQRNVGSYTPVVKYNYSVQNINCLTQLWKEIIDACVDKLWTSTFNIMYRYLLKTNEYGLIDVGLCMDSICLIMLNILFYTYLGIAFNFVRIEIDF